MGLTRHPSAGKSGENRWQPTPQVVHEKPNYLLVDGMTVLQELMAPLEFVRNTRSDTKDSLPMYLAEQLTSTNITAQLMTATPGDWSATTAVTTLNEAGTLTILLAAQVITSGLVVYMYSEETHVVLLAFGRVPDLGSKAALTMGTSECRHKVMLKPIYEEIGQTKQLLYSPGINKLDMTL